MGGLGDIIPGIADINGDIIPLGGASADSKDADGCQLFGSACVDGTEGERGGDVRLFGGPRREPARTCTLCGVGLPSRNWLTTGLFRPLGLNNAFMAKLAGGTGRSGARTWNDAEACIGEVLLLKTSAPLNVAGSGLVAGPIGSVQLADVPAGGPTGSVQLPCGDCGVAEDDQAGCSIESILSMTLIGSAGADASLSMDRREFMTSVSSCCGMAILCASSLLSLAIPSTSKGTSPKNF